MNEKSITYQGFDEETISLFKKIFSEKNIRDLLSDVLKLFNSIIVSRYDSNSHGGFDPESKTPKILINPITGLNDSNISHELIHALQIRSGFPTTPKGLYVEDDIRASVIIELGSNILHIPLVKEMVERKINIEGYLKPTLDEIDNILTNRSEKGYQKLTPFGAHYEACTYLRIHYEAIYVSNGEKNRLIALYEIKTPLAKVLGDRMIKIINENNPYTPEGSIITLYKCVLFLNQVDLSKYYRNYETGSYNELLLVLKQKYQYALHEF